MRDVFERSVAAEAVSIMAVKYGYRYKNYLLDCGSGARLGQRFASQLVISKIGEGAEIALRSFPVLALCASEGDAVKTAKRWGMQWVDNNG